MRKRKTKILALFLSILSISTIFFNVPDLSINTNAATLTSIGLAEYGLMAYEEGWVYYYGGKGEMTSAGVRQSDCSGLIYAYFTDNGTTGPRVVSQQVSASVLHGSLDTIPRIHGLLVTFPNNTHVGIYIGNGYEVDNSDYGTNMVKADITKRNWSMWHLLDAGITYPVNGFYAYNGNMYHYTNYQYDINTTVSYNGVTYTIGSDGIVCDSSGRAIAVDSSMPNNGYTAATNVDLDETITPVNPPSGTPATVTGNSVNLRSTPSTSGSIVATLSKGTTIYITGASVTGSSVTVDGQTSDQWYPATTSSGLSGYISKHYIDYKENSGGDASAPTISLGADYRVYMNVANDDAAIYYTTDCVDPSASVGTIYSTPLMNVTGTTYKAVTVYGNNTSSVTLLTVLTNGATFTDITTSAWYYSFVEEAILLEYFKGNGNNTFSPNSNITRAEFVSALANTAREDVSKYTDISFSDVSDSAWYASAVAWCEEKGYIAGFQDGTFRPNDELTREQLCVILYKYLGLDGTYNSVSVSDFTDHSSISSWAIDAVYACKAEAIVSGMVNGSFEPSSSATRAETATMMVQSDF